MEVSLGVLIIEDFFGTVVVGVAESPESHIAFGGTMAAAKCLKDPSGELVLFAGRAAGVLAWAEKHGMKCETHAVTLDTETQQVKRWQQV
jgi:hypothetical protein